MVPLQHLSLIWHMPFEQIHLQGQPLQLYLNIPSLNSQVDSLLSPGKQRPLKTIIHTQESLMQNTQAVNLQWQ